jgi:hypothetical protein
MDFTRTFDHNKHEKTALKSCSEFTTIFFSVLAWLPKRPIFGRKRNLIGSSCLLSTMSLVWSHFYQIWLWSIIDAYEQISFDTDISRCKNTYIKGVCLAFFGIFMFLEMSVSKILALRRLWYRKTTKIWEKWLQTWFTYIVGFGVGFKCPRKIHLSTQCGGAGHSGSRDEVKFQKITFLPSWPVSIWASVV